MKSWSDRLFWYVAIPTFMLIAAYSLAPTVKGINAWVFS